MDKELQSSGKCTHLDYFEDKSADELRQLHLERYEIHHSTEPDTFGILDERSPEDKTIVIYSKADYEFNEMEELVRSDWVSWRVKFQESFILWALLETKGEFYDNVFSHWDRFVDEDGIFPVNASIAQVNEERRQQNQKG